MIGRLRGTLVDRLAKGPSGPSERGTQVEVLVEVHGVGYRAAVAPGTMAALGPPGGEIVLHTHLHVREDALTLYGFATRDERDCFEALVGAHGVGPALALAILSVHSPADLGRVLADGDLDALTLVPGVGRKTAARLLIELKSRLPVPEEVLDVPAVNGDAGPSARAEVRAALGALGYDPNEVSQTVKQLPGEGDVEELLRTALKLLVGAR